MLLFYLSIKFGRNQIIFIRNVFSFSHHLTQKSFNNFKASLKISDSKLFLRTLTRLHGQLFNRK